MANVIREDIVKVGFDINLKEFTKLNDDINSLKKNLTGDMGSDAFDDLKDSVNGSTDSMSKAKRVANNLSNNLTTLGNKGAKIAFNGLKKIAGISFKALTAGATASAAAIGVLVSKSVSSYANYEQLVGGVNTIFKGSSKKVQKYADNAYKTAGLSANDYMDTVTSFSASLIQSLGGDTNKAADYAHTAITNMSDNANKMGTDMSSLQYAYQGFAKQNYTMLDNLKLGYGGTKEEMKRLVKEAAGMKDVQKELGVTVDANSLSYANIVQAINVVQAKMGIMGTTATEAEGTITGSLNSVKGAWDNLLTGLASGKEIDGYINDMTAQLETFLGNMMPVAERALKGFGTVIEKLAPIIEEKLPALAEQLLPPLIRAAASLVKGLIKALPNIIKTLATTIVDIFGEQFPIIKEIGNMFAENAKKIAKFIPALIGLVAAFKALKAIKSIASVFGGFSFGGGKSNNGSGGFLGSLANTLTNLGKFKATSLIKGLANLSIIMGGFTILSAVFMSVAPQLAKIGDIESTAKMVLIIGALGVVAGVLAKLADIIGKVPVTTVLKGLANMSIMLGAMTALFLLIGAISLIKFDLGRIIGITGILAALGLVGVALTGFAAIVSLVPISTVLLGLANMGVVIAGMSALFLLIGAVSLIDFDLGRVAIITLILGELGIVGSALSVFAGIVGMIPIPVVLAGLANIALVIGGFTGLIIAFGALSKVKGINEFITTGGELLAKLFNVLGKIAGSLLGGFAEGLTSSLPEIGKNLSDFAESLKPMFTAFQGVDISGAGDFFGALGNFLLKLTANDLLSPIMGDNALTTLGTDLSTFATNSESFFKKVATFPEEGFARAKSMFDCLAGISSLPKEGGVVSWFTGTVPYDKIADGLAKLSDEKVLGFFKAVSTLQQGGFDNASKLFDCLGGLKNLPKDGGIFGWFSGDVNYEQIASGLGALGGEGVAKFFNMTAALQPQAFENAKLLFESLAGIDDIDTGNGFWKQIGDKVLGNESKTTLAVLADDLGNFASKTGNFFAQINNLDIGKLNALWDSIKNADGLTADSLKKVDQNINDIIKKVEELPKKMGDGLKKSGGSLGDSLATIWVEAVKKAAKPVNKVIEGANWILEKFGSQKRIAEWTPYAKGTNGHKGGNALVNDGRGAELVQMPNGYTFIPKGRNVFIPNAPKGMRVLPAEQTAQLMGRSSPTFRYAKGIGDVDIWEYIDNASGLVRKISNSISYEGMSEFPLSAAKGMVSTVTGEMSSWVEKLFESEGGKSLKDYVASKGVGQWRSTVIRALKMEGQYSAANVARTLFQMQTESGGNPRAINLWDSNAKKGIPSKGLMQVIDPTFRAYARNGFDKNIYDPLSNILASIRYAVSRYGSLARAYRGKGYVNGGLATTPSTVCENGVPEWVIPTDPSKRKRALGLYYQAGKSLGLPSYSPEQSGSSYVSSTVEHNNYSPQLHFHIEGSSDDKVLTRRIKRVVQEALQDVIDGVERTTPKIREA